MTHIAFYLPSLHGGGAERVTVMLANGFVEAGHSVDVVLANAEGPFLAELLAGVRVIDLGRSSVAASLVPLVRYLRKERPDAMLSALNHCNIAAIIARWLAFRQGMRLVVGEHNAPSQALHGKGMTAVIRRLTRYLYPHADAIVGVSKGICEEMETLMGLPFDKLVCIYNPLDVDNIRTRMTQRPDHPWFRDRDVPVIVAAGRLTTQKDYPTLLRAFALLSAERRVRLAILGQGEDAVALRALTDELSLQGHVEFMGFQDNPYGWMHASNLYVLSSRWEGLPGTLLEALACGSRIVSTNCKTGPDEILEGGKWGRLVPVQDEVALARAMAAALDDRCPPATQQRAEAFRPRQALDGYVQVLGL